MTDKIRLNKKKHHIWFWGLEQIEKYCRYTKTFADKKGVLVDRFIKRFKKIDWNNNINQIKQFLFIKKRNDTEINKPKNNILNTGKISVVYNGK